MLELLDGRGFQAVLPGASLVVQSDGCRKEEPANKHSLKSSLTGNIGPMSLFTTWSHTEAPGQNLQPPTDPNTTVTSQYDASHGSNVRACDAEGFIEAAEPGNHL